MIDNLFYFNMFLFFFRCFKDDVVFFVLSYLMNWKYVVFCIMWLIYMVLYILLFGECLVLSGEVFLSKGFLRGFVNYFYMLLRIIWGW